MGVLVGAAVIVIVFFGLGLQRNMLARFALDLFNEIQVFGRAE
jgi:hypothetical protein